MLFVTANLNLGDASSVDNSVMMYSMLWIAIGFLLYFFRPPSLRNTKNIFRRSNDDNVRVNVLYTCWGFFGNVSVLSRRNFYLYTNVHFKPTNQRYGFGETLNIRCIFGTLIWIDIPRCIDTFGYDEPSRCNFNI